MELSEIKNELSSLANKEKARILQRFFKTENGEYGYGDIFLGVTVPQLRTIARKYSHASERCALSLLKSKIHEERLVALLLLVARFEHGDAKEQEKICALYLTHTSHVNNWDLVDLSADKIVGAYLFRHPKEMGILKRLAGSNSIWERRIAMIATYYFIKNGSSREAFTIARILLRDSHDLIHKAVGWMLRETGKRVSLEEEEQFLEKHAVCMPRTMLRYAIERMPPKTRQYFLDKKMAPRRARGRGMCADDLHTS